MIFFIALLSLIFTIPAFSQSPKKTIKIGFLVRDKKDITIQQTAQLAIDQANAMGGYQGQNFELVTKSCDGPWGITSKQAVALIFEDQVSIVVAALDGRNAHLAEQVTAKSHVVMLSTISSDPTLSKAYVPWYFQMVPDDKQQSKALINEIYIKNKAKKVAIVSLDNYDGKKSIEAFVAETNKRDLPAPHVFVDLEEEELLEKIDENSWDVLVVAGTSRNEIKAARLVEGQNTFAFLNFFSFMDANERFKTVKTPFSPSKDYVHDGISLAIESIQKYGPDTEDIRLGFKDLRYEGLTGMVKFDKFGNRLLE